MPFKYWLRNVIFYLVCVFRVGKNSSANICALNSRCQEDGWELVAVNITSSNNYLNWCLRQLSRYSSLELDRSAIYDELQTEQKILSDIYGCHTLVDGIFSINLPIYSRKSSNFPSRSYLPSLNIHHFSISSSLKNLAVFLYFPRGICFLIKICSWNHGSIGSAKFVLENFNFDENENGKKSNKILHFQRKPQMFICCLIW